MFLPKISKLLVIFALIFLGLLIVPYDITSAAVLDQFEQNVGKNVHEQLLKEYGEYHPSIHKRMWLDEIFSRLVDEVERKQLDYRFTILNTERVNAFAAPGGYVYLTKGMVRVLEDKASMAAAIFGHEIAHIEKKHGLNALLRQMGLTILMEVGLFYFDVAGSEKIRIASSVFLDLVQLGWGREAELEADSYGQQLAYKAGFDPVGAVILMDYLLTLEGDDLPMLIFRTHPPTSERRNALLEQANTYWGPPSAFFEGRKFFSPPRMDPKGRFQLEIVTDQTGSLKLKGYDRQLERQIEWLADYEVSSFDWSKDGESLVCSVLNDGFWQLWVLNRLGNVISKWRTALAGDLVHPVWSEDEMIAFVEQTKDHWRVRVGYYPYQFDLPVSPTYEGEFEGDLTWVREGVVYRIGEEVFLTKTPSIVELVVTNPIPRILQPKPRTTPKVIRDGDSFRISGPKIQLP